jgi:type IV pilus assembly protein PilY1
MQRTWPIRVPTAALATALILLAGRAGAQYTVSQLPYLTPNPPNNVVMMVDDSGSMQSAYVPDQYGQYTNTRRFNSAYFNSLAYSPAILYTDPTPILIANSVLAAGTQTSFAAAAIDGFNPSAGNVNLSSNYQATSSYSPGSSSQNFATPPSAADLAAIGAPAGTAFYYNYQPTLPSCTSSATDDNCYQIVAVTASSAEASNFATWYSFYRTRHLMIASAAAITMADPDLQQARVTWRALSTCTDMTSGNNCKGWDGQVVDNKIRTFTGAQQTNFYHWLSRVPANQSTPTRSTWTSIGSYFSTPLGPDGPYGINPNQPTTDENSGEIACVRNYDITLTDGQWNGDNGATFFGNADASGATFPDTTAYSPSIASKTTVYGNDTNRDVLADIAFRYWSTNLRPDLTNSAGAVAPFCPVGTLTNSLLGGGVQTCADYWNPQNDPATWPHLVQITIGIGMTKTMTLSGLPWWGNNPSTQYSSTGYMNLWNGSQGWPGITNSATQGDIGKAYDLWHAAINSRGLAFSAESPQDLINAMQAGLTRIKATMSAQTSLATNSSALDTNTAVYIGSYTSSDWHGTLTAYGFTSGVLNTAPNWIWNTDNAGTFQPATTRSIITSDNAPAPTGTPPGPVVASVQSGIAFSASDTKFQPIWAAAMGSQANTPASTDILNWLRGDVTKEVRFPPNGLYRNRYTSVLGDIVDSNPVFAWHEDFGYAALPTAEGGSNYLNFIKNKANGTGSIYTGAGMVYVGADDGMLHGFDAGSGKEVFGYVPHNVVPNLPALASPAYGHKFYVDQTPYVGDACVGSGPSSCTWSTVLVGTTGAGGQGVFALDVTNPETMEQASGAVGKVMWDLDGQGATNLSGDPDLGYTIGKPIIARLNTGVWAAIFGNGYLSANGCAVLFVVRLDNGAITKIGTAGDPATTVCTTGNINKSNGLGPPALADVNGDSITDYVYAGDLQGNLWKFDLTSSSALPTAPAYGFTVPFFAASPGNCYPPVNKTTPNTCQPITSRPMLAPAFTGMSGTMIYFGTGRLFAAGDMSTTSTQSIYGILDKGTGPISGGQGALQVETVTDNASTRTFSTTAVAPSKLGWYINLPDTGERVTFSPALIDGWVVFASQTPSSSTCSAGGSGWIMAVWGGGSGDTIGGSNNFFDGNPGINGIQSTGGMPTGLTVFSGAGGNDTLAVSGTKNTQLQKHQSGYKKGRISWHELTR